MKKVLLTAIVAVAALSSCTKDYTCSCTNDLTGLPEQPLEINDASKSDAENRCERWEIPSYETCELD